jgi:hypothetical protein
MRQLSHLKTRAEVAEALGISEKSIERAAAIRRDAPEIFEAIEQGKLSLNRASKMVKANLKSKHLRWDNCPILEPAPKWPSLSAFPKNPSTGPRRSAATAHPRLAFTGKKRLPAKIFLSIV